MIRIVVALSAIALAMVFRAEADGYPVAAARLPLLVSWGVIILSVLMILEVVVPRLRDGTAARLLVPPIDWRELGRSALFIGLVFAYAWAIEPAGYFVATPLFLILSLAIFRAVGWGVILAVTAGITAATWVVFVSFLNLPISLFPQLWAS